VDNTVSQAEELGGSILKSAMDIPTVGRFAVLADPQGAAFSVFTPNEPMPPKGESPGPGEFSWHELGTTDWEAGFGFYSTLFGWVKMDAMDMGEGGIYQMYGQADSAPLGGMYSKSAEMPEGPPSWLYYVVVEDTHKACELLPTLGATVLNGPMEVPGDSGDHIAQCMDPQGAAFAIHSRAQQQ
jgi:predicted enzyme related to lactoylglutathione lyase